MQMVAICQVPGRTLLRAGNLDPDMRASYLGMVDRPPLRRRLADQHDRSARLRRGELAAGLATGAVAAELLFAPAMVIAAVGLVAVGRVSRWRPHWLAAATAVS